VYRNYQAPPRDYKILIGAANWLAPCRDEISESAPWLAPFACANWQEIWPVGLYLSVMSIGLTGSQAR
jgi:hypothetical protein